MAEFQSYYRCTLCTERFFGSCVTTNREVCLAAIRIALGNGLPDDDLVGIIPLLNAVHECFDGSVSVAELLGMKIKKGEDDG